MFRSYVGVIAVLCLAAAVGCDSTSEVRWHGRHGRHRRYGRHRRHGWHRWYRRWHRRHGRHGRRFWDGGHGQVVSLGCTNSVTRRTFRFSIGRSRSIRANRLSQPAQEFTAELDGTAFFAESFLDAALAVVSRTPQVASSWQTSQATVLVRSGATGDPVVLGASDIPYTCASERIGRAVSCDPANDVAGGANTDCMPQWRVQPVPSVRRPSGQRRLL